MNKLFCLGMLLSLGVGGFKLQAAEDYEPIEFKSSFEYPLDSIGLESMDPIDIKFSNEGLEFLKCLEGRILDESTGQNVNRGLGATLIGMGIVAAPVTLGLSVFLAGGGSVVIASAETLKKRLNGWRLIKAAYVHNGYKNPNQDKMAKHDKRIGSFIKKYLKIEADAQTIDRVAKAIVLANEKGWFGMAVNNSVVVLQSTRREDIGKLLFPDNCIHPKLLTDNTAKEKISALLPAL